MLRRRFLEILGLAASAWLLPKPAAESGRCRFHVAGVRFHPAASRVRAGEPLEVRPELFAGERCFGLYSSRGERIGYVPRQLVKEVDGRAVRGAVLSEVRPFAVPWKRLRVTIELG